MPDPENGRLPLENADRGSLGYLMSSLIHLVGVSQAEAARQLGVAASTLSQWCSGARSVDPVGLLWGLRAVPSAKRPEAMRALADAIYGPTYQGRWATSDQPGDIGRFVADGAMALGDAAKIVEGGISRTEAGDARDIARRLRQMAITLDAAADMAEGRVH